MRLKSRRDCLVCPLLMKNIRTAFRMWVGLVGLAACAEDPARTFTVTTLGPVDTQWVARVTAWAGRNLALPVEAGAPLAAEVATLEDAITAALQPRPANQVGRIVLIHPKEVSKAHGVLRPEAGVALINVSAMQADGASDEVVQLRLERQIIRAICMLLGLESSPNPQSAMCTYASLDELDALGRNLDPPWLMRVQTAAKEKGIPVDPSNPFNMVN